MEDCKVSSKKKRRIRRSSKDEVQMFRRLYEWLPKVLGVLLDQKDRGAGTGRGMLSGPLKVSNPRDMFPVRRNSKCTKEGKVGKSTGQLQR